jgi:periplasmic copper chaperone A
MKRILSVLALFMGTAAAAQPTVQVDDPWVRGTVAGQPSTGAFMRLTPTAHTRLVAARSPVAGVVEIHEMAMEGDVMKMRQIPGLDLAAGRTMDLKPGGYHVMLMSLKQPLKGGQSVPLTLVFEDERGKRFEQTLTAPVTALGAGNAAMRAAPASAARP